MRHISVSLIQQRVRRSEGRETESRRQTMTVMSFAYTEQGRSVQKCSPALRNLLLFQCLMADRDFRQWGFWPLATFCKHEYACCNFGVCEAMTRTSKRGVLRLAESISGISPPILSGPVSDSSLRIYLVLEPYPRNQPKAGSQNVTQRAEPRWGG
jgi:hypothetical protein